MTVPTLHQVPPAWDLLSFSPYCAKVQLAFKLKGIPFKVVNTLFASANPRGKLPYVVWGERRLEDSTAIVEAIDAEGTAPKLTPADPKLRGEADLLEDWADESLYWHGVAAKFHHEENWARARPHFTALFSPALRLIGPRVGRRQTLAKLAAQGLSKRAPELVEREFIRHLDSLEVRLEGRTWLVGDSLSIADVAVTAMLWQLLPDYAPWHSNQLRKHPRVMALIAGVRAEADRRAAKT